VELRGRHNDNIRQIVHGLAELLVLVLLLVALLGGTIALDAALNASPS
jgi:hypothetical protein